jgi:hypothetical protein
MRILLALFALTAAIGPAAACEMHDTHAANLASAVTLITPVAQASASVKALPQSKIVEVRALAVSKPKVAGAPYDRGCFRERQTTVYLTQ